MNLLNTVALVTGSAKRLGASSVRALHAAGANVVVHYHTSVNEAEALVLKLNAARANSAIALCSELGTQSQAEFCIEQSLKQWQRLDFLVNNASSFYPTPVGSIDEKSVTDLMASNVTAPLFLTQAAQAELAKVQGAVVNMVDIHGLNPHENHTVYCAAKAALAMITRSMAKEMAPSVRVNGIAPGAILWPEDGSVDEALQQQKIADIPLGRCGTPEDIANLVVYLCSEEARFITGEIIRVDGGRSV